MCHVLSLKFCRNSISNDTFHVLFVLRGLSRSKFKLMELLHVPSSQPYFWQRGFVNEASWMFFFPEGGFARVNPFRFRCRTVQRTCFGTHFVFQLSFFFWQRWLCYVSNREFGIYALRYQTMVRKRWTPTSSYNTYTWDDRVTGVKLSHPTVGRSCFTPFTTVFFGAHLGRLVDSILGRRKKYSDMNPYHPWDEDVYLRIHGWSFVW